MTEPDEALIWARKKAIEGLRGSEFTRSADAKAILGGGGDDWASVQIRTEAYRAGQAASAERIKALKGAIDKLLSACERLDVYEVKSTELWAAYHFGLNVYDDFVWSPEENAEAAASAERIKALEEALEPFAATGAVLETKPKDDVCWAGQRPAPPITFGHLRRAARALLKEADQ